MNVKSFWLIDSHMSESESYDIVYHSTVAPVNVSNISKQTWLLKWAFSFLFVLATIKLSMVRQIVEWQWNFFDRCQCIWQSHFLLCVNRATDPILDTAYRHELVCKVTTTARSSNMLVSTMAFMENAYYSLNYFCGFWIQFIYKSRLLKSFCNIVSHNYLSRWR